MFIVLLGLVSCGKVDSSGGVAEGTPTVVATTGMVADLARNIGGDSVKVTALMGPGVDPHLYKATQGDLDRLQDADVIFFNGLHLEGKMGEVLEKLERTQPVKAVAEGISDQRLLQDPNFRGNFDPHIWFDVSLWAQTIAQVEQALGEVAPQSKDYFAANARAYRTELDSLHQWVQTELDRIPAERRILITAHDAFNYFGRAYNIEVRGLQGISTLSEFGLKDRVELVDYIVDNGVRAVFVETSVSEKNIQAIVEGCEKKGHNVAIGGSLFSDAMGADGTPASTYVGMVRQNVNTMVKALK